MVETYEYSVTADFPNQTVNVGTLDLEIRDEPAITAELLGVELDGDDVTISFDTLLSPDEKAALDNIVANHQGAALVDTPQRSTKLPEETNSTNNWVDVITLSPGQVLGGNWQVTWYCEIGVEDGNGGVLARLTWDGVERTYSSSSSTFYQSFSGSALLTFDNADSPELSLQFRKIGNDTAKIRRCQIALVLEDSQ